MIVSDENVVPLNIRPIDKSSLLTTVSQRSWKQRTFSPMKAGSIRGSIFTLASTAIGAGYLATPNILLNAGAILGLAIIVFCGFLAYWSLYVIAASADKFKIYHYPAVAREMLGNHWGLLLEISIILNGYGAIVALNIIVGSLITNILSSFNLVGGDFERALAMIVLNVSIVTPLGLMRNLGALRWKALFNVICLTFIMFVVIAEFPFFAQHNNFDEVKYVNVDLSIFSAFSLGLFAFMCQQNITGLQEELLNTTIYRINKVSKRAVGIMGTLFCTLSLFGYLSCLKNTPSLIILRTAPSNISNDAAMVVCRIMVLIIMSVAIPLNLNPCRNSIQKLILKIEGRASAFVHYGLSLGIIITTLALAIFFPNIKIAFNFLGGFCGGVIALIIPGLMQVKLTELPLSHWKNIFTIFFTWALAIFGFTSLIIDILEAIS